MLLSIMVYNFTFPPILYESSFYDILSYISSLSFFLIITILTGVRRYLIVVLICISLVTNDIQHFSYVH
jgi:hypothetical protein